MPKLVAPLTDLQPRNAKPKDKPYKLADGGGLYLLVTPDGAKYWRLDYRFDTARKTLAFGKYPEVTLAGARIKRADARKLLDAGIDPGEQRKAMRASRSDRAANSFEVVAREWFEKQRGGWVASHADKIIARLENDVFPWIGARPIAEVTAPELLGVIRRIEGRGVLETAHRALANCGQVFRYAVVTGRADRDPSGDLRGALPAIASRRTHFAAVTEPKHVAALLRALDGYKGTFTVCSALKLAPLFFVRPGELRHAQWADFDLENAEWRYIASKTKTAHVVPLATQSLAILRDLHSLTGEGRFLFPSPRTKDRPMSDNAILSAMRRMGIDKDEMTGHGFRAMARTILDEVLKFPVDHIEHQLAHAVRDPNGRAYNRTTHLPQRKKMMQAWADYLDELKAGAPVVPLRAA
ncbi:integrase arm-type DNA-binding domain-containing protein [uncultured Massilia sp.]|uniref:tyrosine-type recombinase/integrase n=1 Tax=uncultured Massilia sp. TaxID=169973 RepID=UPI0025E4A634|nr:integrase arm-type DNA-binding domain-containing protein [uncultured Massilia sp.]